MTRSDLPKIFYMHIAKTGGSSVNKFFSRIYAEHEFASHFEGFLSANRNSPIDSRLKFISGHISIQSIARLIAQDFIKITVFRDPIKQLASHINWVRAISDDQNSDFYKSHPEAIRTLSKELRALDFSDLSDVDQFFKELQAPGRFLFDNCQTRYLLTKVGRKNLKHADLLEAIKSLGFFDRVGILEELDIFLERIMNEFFSEVLFDHTVGRENTNPSAHITPEIILNSSTMTKLIEYDQVIYSIAATISSKF